jgi:cellulose biosynthesis protein BcsQ
MRKIRLVIADLNTKYLDLLSDFIMTTEYNEKFTIQTFSQQESFDKYRTEPRDTDLLLVDTELLSDMLPAIDTSRIFVLADHDSTRNSLIHINKYQPLNQLLDRILSIYFAKEGIEQNPIIGSKKTKTISVFSAIGFCGKTTLSLNLCKILSEQGHKVFYLNLEYMSSPVIQGDNDNAFSKLLYHIKNKTLEQVEMQLEVLKQHNQTLRFDYVPAPRMAQEMLDMNRQDSNMIIDVIVKSGQYDYLVIDLEASLQERILGALQKSDVVYWLLIDDINCLFKTQRLIEELQLIYNNTNLQPKVSYVLNKSLNQRFNDIQSFGINIQGSLPYIPEWKAVYNLQQFYSSMEFLRAVRNLMGSH